MLLAMITLLMTSYKIVELDALTTAKSRCGPLKLQKCWKFYFDHAVASKKKTDSCINVTQSSTEELLVGKERVFPFLW